MPDSPDYRKYLEEKFEGIKIHLDDSIKILREELVGIKIQTTLTNSRVTHLEADIERLELADEVHIKECPAMPEIKEIKDNLTPLYFFKKYPKLLKYVIIGVVTALLGMSTFDFVKQFVKTKIPISLHILNSTNRPIIPVDTINNQK